MSETMAVLKKGGGGSAQVGPTNPAPVTGRDYSSSVSIGRPENATDYAALDVIGIADAGTPASAGSAIIEFENIGPVGGGEIILVDWDLTIGLTAVTSGMAGFRLHLYSASPTAILDNAAFDLKDADRATHLGYIDVGTPVDMGSNLFAQSDQINKSFILTSSSLFGQLKTIGGYTPASATVYIPRLRAIGA